MTRRRGLLVAALVSAAAMGLMPLAASAGSSTTGNPTGIGQGDPTSVNAYNYAWTGGGTPPTPVTPGQPGSVAVAPPGPPAAGSPCIDTKNIWQGVPAGVRNANDQGTTNFMVTVTPTLTAFAGGYHTSVSISIPSSYDGTYHYTTLTANGPDIISSQATEQGMSQSLADAYNSAAQQDASSLNALIPGLGSLLLSITPPYTPSQFPVNLTTTPADGSIAYAENLATWNVQVDVYLTSGGTWVQDNHQVTTTTTDPTTGKQTTTTQTQPWDGHFHCNMPSIANVDVPVLQTPTPATPNSPGPPGSLLSLGTHILHNAVKPTIGTYPGGNGVGGNPRTYVHIPTYAWLDSTGSALPRTPLVVAAPVVPVPGSGNGAVIVYEYFKVTIVPDQLTWQFHDITGDNHGGTTGYGSKPATVPTYNPVNQQWQGGNPGSLDSIWHEYAAVNQTPTAITATQNFHVVVQGFYNNGVTGNVPVPGCTDQSHAGYADVCSWSTTPETYTSAKLTVDQIEGVPYFPTNG